MSRFTIDIRPTLSAAHQPTWFDLVRRNLRWMELTVLGQTVRHAIDHVEVFAAPAHVTRVTFTNDELNSMCPVTQQPDLSTVVIDYEPDEWCVESKSLKLYLWSFRDRAVFAEALSAEIAAEIMLTAVPKRVTVTVTQRPRGGIEVRTVAEMHR
jgi:7-cyano-7-deazaguanine reductase